jgi:multiphosphoryl transfer protein
MPSEYLFRFPLPNGLHARPSSVFQEAAVHFEAHIDLINKRTGYRADAKSVLALMSADVRYDDPCRLLINGFDETEAHRVFVTFLKNDFPLCDDLLATNFPIGDHFPLPRSLTLEAGQYSIGTCVSPGIGKGRLICMQKWNPSPVISQEAPSGLDNEMRRFRNARMACVHALSKEIAEATKSLQQDILKAHLAILRDPSFNHQVEDFLIRPGYAAGRAIDGAARIFISNLGKSENPYLRERVLDIQDVARRLIEQIYGSQAGSRVETLTEPSIVLAPSLTPSQFLELDHAWVSGLILPDMGATSHTSILARAFGIPTIAEVTIAQSACVASTKAILDANRGLFIVEATASVDRYYHRKMEKLSAAEAAQSQEFPVSLTRDGHSFSILANVSTTQEVERAFSRDAEGIGLFRTEILFTDRTEPPSEEEQLKVYSASINAARGRSITIRTLDIGGDKPMPYLKFRGERNPSLENRGKRLYRDWPEMVKIQMRAILRASVHGPSRIMFPAVGSLEEAQMALALFREAQAELRVLDVPFNDTMDVGIMLEIPSMAFCLKELCEDFTFFSIGSNELLRHFFAADRDHSAAATLASPLSPSFWRLLKYVAEELHSHNRTVSLCGEIAAEPEFLALLAGLHFESVSVSAINIRRAKVALGQLNLTTCRELVESVVQSRTDAEVQAILEEYKRSRSLLDRGLISIDSDAETKEEVIEDLVDLLSQTSRVNNAALVEDVIRRKAIHATGLKYGFAISHCWSDEIQANSIVFIRLKKPLLWGRANDSVTNIILLAIRKSDDSNTQLRILSRLSRLITLKRFCEDLFTAVNLGDTINILSRGLEIPL